MFFYLLYSIKSFKMSFLDSIFVFHLKPQKLKIKNQEQAKFVFFTYRESKHYYIRK